jgi:asparaginyl-tRNA synthetase
MNIPRTPLTSPAPQAALPYSSRVSENANIARVKASLLRAAQDTLDAEGFTQVVAPILTELSGACGEPGTLIPVSIQGRRSYLRQTSQLHLEPLMRELGRVYSVGRSFRAERRSSHRHLTEFTLIEAEAVDWTLPELMSLVEQMTVNMLHHAAGTAPAQLRALGAEPGEIQAIRAPFKRMTYDQAVIALQRAGHFIEWGEDLSELHEIALAEMAGGPLFVTHYPVETRFFTMKICRHDPRVVECCDLLLPGVGEVMGASETEPDAALLEARMSSSRGIRQIIDLGGDASDYNWYLEMHREGSCGQAGFGLGFERLVRYVCKLDSIQKAAV